VRPITLTATGTGTTVAELPYQVINTGYQLTFSGGSATASAQYTLDDIQNTASGSVHWFNITGLAAISADAVAWLTQSPVTAVRLNVTAFTSGPVVLRILAGGYA